MVKKIGTFFSFSKSKEVFLVACTLLVNNIDRMSWSDGEDGNYWWPTASTGTIDGLFAASNSYWCRRSRYPSGELEQQRLDHQEAAAAACAWIHAHQRLQSCGSDELTLQPPPCRLRPAADRLLTTTEEQCQQQQVVLILLHWLPHTS